MKERFVFIIAIMLILASAGAIAATTQPPQAGSSLPEMKLLKPVDASELQYLGLSGAGFFHRTK
ncbi:MAG: hypothetical protein FD159_2132 [Syntrophaceae bacterium]|nr:MAG: hypothetical protein FD159_2132 [Syntrophaceae bacterium]